MENAFLALAILACPIGMGVMMWVMARGLGGKKDDAASPGEVERLRSEQERLSAEVKRLERERGGEREIAAR